MELINFALSLQELQRVMELSKTKAAVYATLSQKKMRLKHSLFIVEGEKCVQDTAGNFEPEALVATERWLSAGNQLIDCFPPERVFSAPENILNKISSLSNSPEVLAVYKLPGRETVEPLDRVDKEGLNLLLDGIQDPGNLGTIIRTAHWFGIKKIFASKDTADIYNPKTLQSTMGSINKVEVHYCLLSDLIAAFPGMPVYGTLLEGRNIYESPLSKAGFIIMGNEGKGISIELRKMVTDGLYIPPFCEDNHSESLNVAIATGITLSQFRSRSFQNHK